MSPLVREILRFVGSLGIFEYKIVLIEYPTDKVVALERLMRLTIPRVKDGYSYPRPAIPAGMHGRHIELGQLIQ